MDPHLACAFRLLTCAWGSTVLVACCAKPQQTSLFSNRPLVVVNDQGTRFGISNALQKDQPVELAISTWLTPVKPATDATCYSQEQLDQRFTAGHFGSACQQTDEPKSSVANPQHALWYCSDEWIVRVVVAPCDAASARAPFRIVQIALRNRAQLR